MDAKTKEKKTIRKVRGITMNYATSQLVNFDRIKDMILGTDNQDVISVRIERKNNFKMRRCDGSGPSSSDMVTLVSEPEVKFY